MPRIVHIIGAGLAGLSAAVRLATPDNRVIVHEATAFAGGRCRSYHDASVGMIIDNGNHLLLSGNRAAFQIKERKFGRRRADQALLRTDRAQKIERRAIA